MEEEEKKHPLQIALEGIQLANEQQKKIISEAEKGRHETNQILIDLTEIADLIKSAPHDLISGFDKVSKESSSKLTSDFDIALKSSNKLFKRVSKASLIICFLSFLIAASSFYFAVHFYKTSVLSREEVRSEILKEFEDKNQAFYDMDFYDALVSEKDMLSYFSKKYPNKINGYKLYREGVISTARTPVFKNIKTDKIIKSN